MIRCSPGKKHAEILLRAQGEIKGDATGAASSFDDVGRV